MDNRKDEGENDMKRVLAIALLFLSTTCFAQEITPLTLDLDKILPSVDLILNGHWYTAPELQAYSKDADVCFQERNAYALQAPGTVTTFDRNIQIFKSGLCPDLSHPGYVKQCPVGEPVWVNNEALTKNQAANCDIWGYLGCQRDIASVAGGSTWVRGKTINISVDVVDDAIVIKVKP